MAAHSKNAQRQSWAKYDKIIHQALYNISMITFSQGIVMKNETLVKHISWRRPVNDPEAIKKKKKIVFAQWLSSLPT